MDPLLLLLLLLLLEAPILISAVPNDSNPSPLFSISLSPLSSPSSSSFSSPTSPSGSVANSNAMPLLSPGLHVGGDKHGIDSHQKLLISLIVACSLLVFILSLLLCIWVYQKMFSGKSTYCGRSDVEKGVPLAPFLSKLSSSTGAVNGKNVSFFDHKTLDRATNSFKESNILGEGGFGCVYKAKLEDNHQVAVKKLDSPSQDAKREFENEVHLLSRMHHSNIISLLGYSIDGDTKFIIYELMQNGSLETQLHGPSRGSELTWHMRMKIALDTARSAPGLEYLHEHCNPPVIHRDLKSSNILLDAEFNAKLSDFGLAVTDGSQNKNDFKLSGTLGYVAPEYMLHGKLTDKSDVYAFGVVLLELLLGRKPVEKLETAQCQSIVTWAMPQLTDRSKLPNIVDVTIKDTMDLKHLYQVAAVAALCVQPEPSYRPLITDVMHSLIPLVTVELGGTLRTTQPPIPRDG